jgi:hypothetical protein
VLDGIEPPTRALSRRCSNHLSYSTMALGEGIEPSTQRLTVSRSTAELPQNCPRIAHFAHCRADSKRDEYETSVLKQYIQIRFSIQLNRNCHIFLACHKLTKLKLFRRNPCNRIVSMVVPFWLFGIDFALIQIIVTHFQ